MFIFDRFMLVAMAVVVTLSLGQGALATIGRFQRGGFDIWRDWAVLIEPSIGALVVTFALWAAKSTRLVITDVGIEYYEPGLKLAAKWPDVVRVLRFRKQLIRGSIVREYLVLSASQVSSIPPWDHINRWLGRDLRIPIDLFDIDWSTSKLGQLIYERAPQLLE
jgi:hypothetical protein